MKFIVSRSDKVEVIIYCYEVGDDIEATSTKEEIPKSVEQVEMIHLSFRRPSHGDSQSIFRQCNFQPNVTGSGAATMDVTDLQEAVLRTLLVGWDIKDDNDKTLPVTAGNVNSLAPAIARAAASGCLSVIKL